MEIEPKEFMKRAPFSVEALNGWKAEEFMLETKLSKY
jgi:hypothetical protein